MRQLSRAAQRPDPTPLQVIENTIEALRETVERIEKEAIETGERRDREIAGKQGEIERLKDHVAELSGNVTEFVRVYRNIEAGRIDEAKFALDRVLCEMDSAWRTRA